MWNRLVAATALGILALTVGMFALADDAEATHFWSGSLSWSPAYEDTALEDLELGIRIHGFLGFDTKSFPRDCAALNVGEPTASHSSYLTVDGTTVSNWVLEVVYVDPNPSGGGTGGHCRYAGKIVDGSGEDGVFWSTMGYAAGHRLEIEWGNGWCCREDHDHVNNPNKNVQLLTYMTVGDPNDSPVIDFPHLTRITSHGAAAYGNHHCPKDSFCKFYVPANDLNNDTLSWRLASSQEAIGVSTGFYHPGAPWTGPFEIDSTTGLVTWDTTGASVGEIYSTQIIVEDPMTQVPVDFMVEIGKGCENGSKGVVDPFTGELVCETPPPPPPTPSRCEEQPDADGCNPVPPRPPEGKAYEHTFWPAPRQYLVMPAAVSDSEAIASGPGDSSVSDVSGIDSDGDTITDGDDRCPGSDTPLNNDMDNDGLGDGCDTDDDGDGIPDEMDACPLNPDADCATQGTGMDAASGTEASRGFFQPSAAPQKADARARLQASDEATSMGGTWIILVGLAAAMLVLLLVASRRRR